jgi:putative ABC transport system permease protein
MKTLRYLARVALLQLRQSPGRTALTAGAVGVAVALWVSVLSFTTNYQNSLAASIRTMGYEVLVTVKGCPYETASLVLQGGNIPMYVNEAIFQQVVADRDVASATRFLMRAIPDESADRIRVYMGVDERFFPMKPWLTLQQGAWFSSPSAGEAILGYGAAERLRYNLGDEIEVLPNLAKVKVVGILDRCGGQDDGTIFMPLYRAQRLFDKKEQLSGIGVKLRALTALEDFSERANQIPSVQVISLPQVQTTIFRLIGTGRAFALGTAFVAILVALMGVTNAVLMSVVQRTRQIGIMRALGAGQRDVYTLVAAEALALCALGGLVGVVLALLVSGGVSGVLTELLPFTPAESSAGLSLQAALVALGGTLVIGVVAGIYPGWRAGRIAPVLAMRD